MAGAARTRRPNLKVPFITGLAENALLDNDNDQPGMGLLTKPVAVDNLAGASAS